MSSQPKNYQVISSSVTDIREKNVSELPKVCIMGLGFVGAAMAAVVADAKNADGERLYEVTGLELDTDQGRHRSTSIAAGKFPFQSNESHLSRAIEAAVIAGNLTATTDTTVLAKADIIIVDIPLDVAFNEVPARANFEDFENSINTIAHYIKPNSLIIVETTVPPGTCENIVYPSLKHELDKRSIPISKISLAHSFERVMPGPKYMESIKNYWRSYAGIDDNSAHKCSEFLSSIINVEDYPLTRLSTTTASETAKILENSYRAINIALIDEWSVFAEAAGLDLFEILNAIKVRPTHSNIMRPGFGVGGYCLTKDIFFGEISVNTFFAEHPNPFLFTKLANQVNTAMPIRNLNRIEDLLGGNLQNKHLIMLGVAYRSEVSDTRYAASQLFFEEARKRGCTIEAHDPFVGEWVEKGIMVPKSLPEVEGADAVVFCVPHLQYSEIDILDWLGNQRPLVYDCDSVLTQEQRSELSNNAIYFASTGRGL